MFRHFEMDLIPYTFNSTPKYIDIPYLINFQILRDETTFSFQDREGNTLFFTLPQPSITGLHVFENITFLPGPEFLCANPLAPLASPPHGDVNMIYTEKARKDSFMDAQYDLMPISDEPDVETYMRWMIDAHHKNNSLMNRILHAVTGGYFQGTSLGAAREERRAAQEQAARKEPSAVGARRGSNKRYAGPPDIEESE